MMHVWRVVWVVACLVAVGVAVRNDNYELRRPIKYFFHLLELKADINPLLHHMTVENRGCSSKAGPFCSLTQHRPLQRRKLTQPSEEMANIHSILKQIEHSSVVSLDEIETGLNHYFVIRHGLVNNYDEYLKSLIGEAMHQEDMLSPSLFTEVY